jgi:segregation and condensation protein A
MSYEIRIENFEGPLDLLLHLIKKNEMDIYNIPIADITAQYVAYIDAMKNLNLDVAGEFLLMAATLIHIKSRLLLPQTQEDEPEEEEEDPRAELVRRLLEYQKYKEAALSLDAMPLLGREVFARTFPSPSRGTEESDSRQSACTTGRSVPLDSAGSTAREAITRSMSTNVGDRAGECDPDHSRWP